jgi:hypothetical protein
MAAGLPCLAMVWGPVASMRFVPIVGSSFSYPSRLFVNQGSRKAITVLSGWKGIGAAFALRSGIVLDPGILFCQ